MGSAVLSACGLYRYRLERELGALAGRGVCAFVMLNPSTADATADDATIRRCRRFATDVGAARLVVGNLYAYRATDPADLYLASFATAGDTRGDVIGPDNDQHLAAIIAEADTLIGAWGAPRADVAGDSPRHRRRAQRNGRAAQAGRGGLDA